MELHRTIRKMFPASWLHGIRLPPLEDFANSPADRKLGEDASKQIAKALNVKPEMEACFDRCTVTKMIQRKKHFIAQFFLDKLQ